MSVLMPFSIGFRVINGIIPAAIGQGKGQELADRFFPACDQMQIVAIRDPSRSITMASIALAGIVTSAIVLEDQGCHERQYSVAGTLEDPAGTPQDPAGSPTAQRSDQSVLDILEYRLCAACREIPKGLARSAQVCGFGFPTVVSIRACPARSP
jgi:hypothetical protein